MINHLEILSIKSVYKKDPEYFQRRVCRYYSEKFHTPLTEVLELPWPFVFQNYLEHVVENNNTQQEILDLAKEICYPNRKVVNALGEFDNEEAEMQAWIRKIEQEEEEKRRKIREMAKPKEEKEVESKSTNNEEEEIHMNENMFSHLEDEIDED